MSGQGQLDWGAVTEDEFNRWAEALIVQKHVDEGGCKVFVLDGAGGDGGIDIGVERNGVVEHIYQLKYFREGFSGGFRDVRRKQIKKSFNRAVTNHDPKFWTLVFPAKIKETEREWLYDKLAGDRVTPAIDHMGSTELDLLLAKYPQIHALATRDALIETLRIWGGEHKALTKPEDLGNRLRDLAGIANSRSEFWGVNVEVAADGSTTSSLMAKRPDAAEREPIAWNLKTEFGEEHKRLQRDYQQALDYGAIKPIVLPPDVVRSLSITGPEWIAEDREHVHVELHPAAPGAVFPLDLKVLGAVGNVRVALKCTARSIGSGQKGGRVLIEYNGCLKVIWQMDKGSVKGRVDFTPNLIGAAAGDAVRVLQFFDALTETRILSFSIRGKANTATMQKRKRVPVFLPPAAMEHLQDLAFLEREFDTTFVVKKNVSGAERKRARFVRMLREGKFPINPGVQSFYGTLSGEETEKIEATLTAPHAFQLTEDEFLLDVQDQKLLVGQVATLCPHVVAEDIEEHLRALHAGEAEGRTIILGPADDTAFISYMPQRVVDVNAPIVPDPWNLLGGEEHPNLARMRASAVKGPPEVE